MLKDVLIRTIIYVCIHKVVLCMDSLADPFMNTRSMNLYFSMVSLKKFPVKIIGNIRTHSEILNEHVANPQLLDYLLEGRYHND